MVWSAASFGKPLKCPGARRHREGTRRRWERAHGSGQPTGVVQLLETIWAHIPDRQLVTSVYELGILHETRVDWIAAAGQARRTPMAGLTMVLILP